MITLVFAISVAFLPHSERRAVTTPPTAAPPARSCPPSDEACRVATSLIPVQFVDNSILSAIADNKILIDNSSSSDADTNAVECSYNDPYGAHAVTLRPTDAPAAGVSSQVGVRPIALPVQAQAEGDPRSFTDYEGLFGQVEESTTDGGGGAYRRRAVGGAPAGGPRWTATYDEGRGLPRQQGNDRDVSVAPVPTPQPIAPAPTPQAVALGPTPQADAPTPTSQPKRVHGHWVAVLSASVAAFGLSASTAIRRRREQKHTYKPPLALAFVSFALIVASSIALFANETPPVLSPTAAPTTAPTAGPTAAPTTAPTAGPTAAPRDRAGEVRLRTWLPVALASAIGVLVCLKTFLTDGARHFGSSELNIVPYFLLSFVALSVVGFLQAFDAPPRPPSDAQPLATGAPRASNADVWSRIVITHVALVTFGAMRIQAHQFPHFQSLSDVIVILSAAAAAAADAAAVRQATGSNAAGIASGFGIVLALWWLVHAPTFKLSSNRQ